MPKNEIVIKGILSLHSVGDYSDVLYVSSIEDPLAEHLDIIHNKNVTISYYISDKEASEDQLQKNYFEKLMGVPKVDFGAVYSELTGHLWTNEKVMVGGHKLIEELKTHNQKYLYMKIKIHSNKKG